MIDWLVQNKEWMFSGLAIAIPVAFFGWVRNKKKPQNTTQQQVTGNNSVNNQVGNNQYTAHDGSKIYIKEQNDEKRIEFIRDMIIGVLAIIFTAIAFFTNPKAEVHVMHIARGPFVSYKLDHDFFYENNFVYSRLYVVTKENEKVYFTWGVFSKVIETSNYQYNLQRLGSN